MTKRGGRRRVPRRSPERGGNGALSGSRIHNGAGHPRNWLGLAILIGQLAAGPALARPSPELPARPATMTADDASGPALRPLARASGIEVQGRALLLTGPPAGIPIPLAQPMALPQPVPLDPAALNESPPVLSNWWFWAAVGTLVVGTVVLFAVGTRGQDVPGTQLGNMEIFN